MQEALKDGRITTTETAQMMTTIFSDVVGAMVIAFGMVMFNKVIRGNPGELTTTETTIIEGTKKEVKWGEESYGKKKWAEGLWGKVAGSKVTLFHGTSESLVNDIIKSGLQPSYAGWFYEQEEAEEIPIGERPTPAVWLAYTPYLAFFFGDAVIQVTIPLSWIEEANDGVLVERAIPPAMIDRYMLIGDWK